MNQKGFSIIDLSIILIVLGLLVSASVQGYLAWSAGHVEETTSANLQAIQRAVSTYYQKNDRYPCPADLTKSIDDSDYGEENCSGSPVMVGGVPFKALRLPEIQAYDAWSRKIIYAVGTIYTDSATFPDSDSDPLAISIRRFNNQGNEIPPSTANPNRGQVVFLSTGVEGVGGYTRNGQQVSPCDTSTREGENCDGDDSFIRSRNLRNLLPGTKYYDDLMMTLDGPPRRTWYSSPTDADDIFTTVPAIGIGHNKPVYNIDVDGSILTTDANAGLLCDASGNDCFAPAKIGGDGMKCAPVVGTNPRAMIGIAHSHTKCGTTYSQPASGDCGPGELMTGLDASGNIICSPVN